MGWRFRRSVKIAPGVRLNLGSKSWGISTGTRGFRISSNTKSGTQVSAGIPGTGLSYRKKISSAALGTHGTANAGDVDRVTGCLALWALLSPVSCSGVGCLTLVVALCVLAWIIQIVVMALKIALALAVGLSPIIIGIGVAAVIATTDIMQQDKRHLVAAATLVGGIWLNVFFLWLMPEYYPTTAIHRILLHGQPNRTVAQSEGGTTQLEATPIQNTASSASPSQVATAIGNSASASSAAPLPASQLLILQSAFSIQRLRHQRLTSMMQAQGHTVGIPTDMKPSIRDVVWTLRLKNNGAQEITSLSYAPVFERADGTPVERATGFSDKARADVRYDCTLVSVERVPLHLRPGEQHTLVLNELVSQVASQQIKRAHLDLTAKVAASPTAPSRSAP